MSFTLSASFNCLLVTPSSKSFIKIINNITVTCGTPLRTYIHDDLWPFRTTLCCLSFNHGAIHILTLPVIPNASSFHSKRWWGTLSKAFWKSRRRGHRSPCCFLVGEDKIWSSTSSTRGSTAVFIGVPLSHWASWVIMMQVLRSGLDLETTKTTFQRSWTWS